MKRFTLIITLAIVLTFLVTSMAGCGTSVRREPIVVDDGPVSLELQNEPTGGITNWSVSVVLSNDSSETVLVEKTSLVNTDIDEFLNTRQVDWKVEISPGNFVSDKYWEGDQYDVYKLDGADQPYQIITIKY